jgi:hypothetical protein
MCHSQKENRIVFEKFKNGSLTDESEYSPVVGQMYGQLVALQLIGPQQNRARCWPTGTNGS